MKSKKNLLEQVKTLSYFGKNTLYQLGKQLGLKDASIDTYISRFLKNREIVLLMRGVYVTTDFFEKNRTDISYSFYLANIIRKPSYISSWAALQYYDLATEAIHSITSVTPKVTREYRTRVGNFAYQSIDKRLFSDFVLKKGNFDFFIATPSKALFDLLYFRTRGFRGVAIDRVGSIIEELRIEFDEMDEKEQKKFNFMLKKYYERTA